MDLDKLKISDEKRERKASKVPIVILCVLCLGLGYAGGKYLKIGGPKALKVKTSVVRNSSQKTVRQFTAGGWIEASAPRYPIIISSRVAERIDKINVKRGDVVKPGQLIVEMYDKDFKTRLDLAKSKLEAAKKELELLETGHRKEDIEAAAAHLVDTEEQVRIAKANYDRIKKLEKGVVSDQEIDNAYALYKQAEARKVAAEAIHRKLESGYREERIYVARSKYNELKSEYELAERDCEYCRIKVPENSPELRVLSVFRHVGEEIYKDRKNAEILSLYDPLDMQVRVDIPQSNIKHVKAGYGAVITTEALQGKEYKGKVLRVEPKAELSKNTITAKIRVENPDDMLFPDMIAKVTFLQKAETGPRKKGALIIPKVALIKKDGADCVYVILNGTARLQTVKITDPNAAPGSVAVEGLNSGQRVIISELDKLKEGLPVEE